jgi:hypothetical protein
LPDNVLQLPDLGVTMTVNPDKSVTIVASEGFLSVTKTVPAVETQQIKAWALANL